LPSGANTGFDKKDVMAKFRIQSKPTNKIHHAIDFKWVYAEEDANETYLGLTEEEQYVLMSIRKVEFILMIEILDYTRDIRVSFPEIFNA
jgi:hypothetical protein